VCPKLGIELGDLANRLAQPTLGGDGLGAGMVARA
jgi:hypothetical protein